MYERKKAGRAGKVNTQERQGGVTWLHETSAQSTGRSDRSPNKGLAVAMTRVPMRHGGMHHMRAGLDSHGQEPTAYVDARIHDAQPYVHVHVQMRSCAWKKKKRTQEEEEEEA